MRGVLILVILGTCQLTHAQVLDSLPLRSGREVELYRQTLNKLNNTVFNIDWKEVNLRDAIADIRRQTRLNFVVTRNADESGFDELTLRLRNVSGRLILHFLKDHGKIVFQFRRGAIFVTSKADAVRRGATLRIYSVHDLLYVPPDFPGPRIGISPNAPGEEEEQEVVERESHDPERIVEIIKMATGESNCEYEGVSIDIHRGRMIVRHTPIMQRRVRYMIAALGAF